MQSLLPQQNSRMATTKASASPQSSTTKIPPILTTPRADAISFRDLPRWQSSAEVCKVAVLMVFWDCL